MESRPGFRIGVDIVAISEIEHFVGVHRDRLERLYTDREIAYCQGKANSAESFAARFAAKEAVLKALGGGEVDFRDIEIVNDFWGRPEVHIRAETGLKEVSSVSVSLSHSGDYAIAYALVVPE